MGHGNIRLGVEEGGVVGMLTLHGRDVEKLCFCSDCPKTINASLTEKSLPMFNHHHHLQNH